MNTWLPREADLGHRRRRAAFARPPACLLSRRGGRGLPRLSRRRVRGRRATAARRTRHVGHGVPGKQVFAGSMRDDQTLFLFVFRDKYLPKPGDRPTSGARQHWRSVFTDVGWECPQILKAMRERRQHLLRPRQPDPHEPLDEGPHGADRRRRGLRSLWPGKARGWRWREAYVLAGDSPLRRRPSHSLRPLPGANDAVLESGSSSASNWVRHSPRRRHSAFHFATSSPGCCDCPSCSISFLAARCVTISSCRTTDSEVRGFGLLGPAQLVRFQPSSHLVRSGSVGGVQMATIPCVLDRR